MKALVVLAFVACGPANVIHPTPPTPLAIQLGVPIDTTPKERRRMVPPEAYLAAYLTWFGGLAPLDVQQRARGKAMFDAWDDYLSALGLPDYRLDLPRATQSNTLMLATLGRLGEVLCARAAEHDLRGKAPPPIDARVIFAFEAGATDVALTAGIDVLHRTFLGYPLALAPQGRGPRLIALYRAVAAHHAGAKAPLTADETAWVSVCSALVQHPETGLY